MKIRVFFTESLPTGTTGVLIEYVLGVSRTEIGKFAVLPSYEFKLPDTDAQIAVYMTPICGRPIDSTKLLVNSQALIPTDVPVPEPKIQANPLDNSLTVTVPGQDGVGFEIRTSDPDTDPEDAWVQESAQPYQSEVIFAIAEPKQTVHVRTVRDEDGALSDWVSTTIETPETPQEIVELSDDDDVDNINIDPIVPGSDIYPAETDAGLMSFIPGPDIDTLTGSGGPYIESLTGTGGPLICHMIGPYFPEARIQSDLYEAAFAHDFLPRSIHTVEQMGHGANTGDLDSAALLFDMNPLLPSFREQPLLYPHLNPLTDDRGGDESGVVTEEEIQLVDGSDNTGEYMPVVPGHRYRAMKCKLAKKIINPLGGRNFQINRWRRSRLLRNRKFEFNTGTLTYSGSPPDRCGFTFPVPLELVQITKAVVTIHDASHDSDDGISYQAHVISVDREGIVFSVTQTVWGNVTTDAILKTATITWPRAFANGARISAGLTPVNAVVEEAWMTGAPTAANVAIATALGGTVVYYSAMGAPVANGISAEIVVAGF